MLLSDDWRYKLPNKQGEGKIDWTDFTWNPVKGRCYNDCFYCYMDGIYRRFKKLDHDPEMDRVELGGPPMGDIKVFVQSINDLFHPQMVTEHKQWIYDILAMIEKSDPQTIFQFLTKFPGEYAKFDFSENCWLGATVDGLSHTQDNVYKLLSSTKPTHIRFLSLEPLMSEPGPYSLLPIPPLDTDYPYIPEQYGIPDWIIVGQNTSPGAMRIPKAWVDILVSSAKKMQIPVWMKDSLSFMDYMIKELPVSKHHIKVIQEPREPVLYSDEFPNGPCGRRVTFPDKELPPLT